MMITPAAAISDEHLLGHAFVGPTWARWVAVLKAAFAERMNAEELMLFREVAERDPPRRQVRELWAIVGRRGGKDSIASAIAATLSLGDYRPYLRPGERASVLCLACDRDQAKIVARYIAAYFRENPLLAPLVEHASDDGLELSNAVEIVVATNSFRSVRGRTIVCVVFDEVAYWRSDESANPDVEVLNAVTPGLITLPGAMLVGITTAYRRAGLAYERWHAHYGQPDDDVLVVRGTSRQFNMLLPQEVIDNALARDQEAASAEYLSQWRDDLSNFLDRELVEAAIDRDVQARPPLPGTRYVSFLDPSGGRGDSFTAAIAHADGDAIVLDALYERRAPFDPETTTVDIAALLRAYGIGEAVGDRYAAGWVVGAFAKHGITYRHSERDRSKIYIDALALFTSGRCRLLDNARLVGQLVALERRTTRLGRDQVGHPPNAHDDLANAVCGAITLCVEGGDVDLHRRLGQMGPNEGFDAISPDYTGKTLSGHLLDPLDPQWWGQR